MIVTMLAAAGFAVALLLVGEGYFLIARAQRLLDYAEQLQAAGALLLAAVPSKSAPRTDGSSDVPAQHWTRLTALDAEEPHPDTVEIPTIRTPERTDTVETEAALDAGLATITAPPAATTTRVIGGHAFTFLDGPS